MNKELIIDPKNGIVLDDEIKESIIDLMPEDTIFKVISVFILNVKPNKYCYSFNYSINGDEYSRKTEPEKDIERKNINFNKLIYGTVSLHFESVKPDRKNAKKSKS